MVQSLPNRHFFRGLAALILVGLVALAAPAEQGSAKAGAYLKRQLRHDRVKAAYDAHRAELRETFARVGAAWPPSNVFLRAFKTEDTLEVWAQGAALGDGALVRVETIPICARSGGLGPKRQQGDLQVPEGVYAIDRFNPWSSYHLSLGLNYPNTYDRAVGHRRPGSDIFIHGDCVTIGCLPIEDGPIERLFVLATLARDGGQRRIPVHLMPCRFGSQSCEEALRAAGTAARWLLWDQLRPIAAAFDAHHRVPKVRVDKSGYVLRTLGETR